MAIFKWKQYKATSERVRKRLSRRVEKTRYVEKTVLVDTKYLGNNKMQYIYETRKVPEKYYETEYYYDYVTEYKKGDYIGEITATNEKQYPKNGEKSGYWYEYIGLNGPPVISGSNTDLGAKVSNFDVEYVVQDPENDEVKVEIKVDDIRVQAPTVTTLGVKRYYNVDLKDLKLGKHKIEIIATDTKGESSNRTYTFQKVNSAPIISGMDEDLGAKNTAFTYTYQVSDSEGDSVKVVEKLNGEVIRTLDNAPLDEDLYITIDVDTIKELELNQANIIEIEASDGTAKSFRRIRFTRNNIPPIISDVDKDLGEFTNTFSYKWSATDPEGDKMSAVIYLDDKIIKDRHSIEDNEEQTIEFTGLDMFKIPRGKHTIRIVVEDDKGFSSERKVTFTRKIERLIMKLAGNGIETEEMAKRILVSSVGVYVAKGAVVKYEVCNNSFDENPTWEDATNMVKAGKAFNFQNATKTSEKSGIDVKVTIEKGTSTGLSFINAIGGSYD